jgi:SAM-dependent methyltransferase
MSTELSQLIQQTIQRYSDRYKKLGYDVKTLGWGTKEQQEYRFSQSLISDIDLNDKEILDLGCGFGDFYTFIKSQNIRIKKYLGCDLNPDLIKEAEKIYYRSKEASFKVLNLFEINNDIAPLGDIGFMFGLLNLNWKEKYDNYEYSKKAITNAYSLIKEVLIVDFLSSNLSSEYPKEDFVFYHDPKVMFEFALSLSNNVILKHNYLPIPQKEFMLFIFKE